MKVVKTQYKKDNLIDTVITYNNGWVEYQAGFDSLYVKGDMVLMVTHWRDWLFRKCYFNYKGECFKISLWWKKPKEDGADYFIGYSDQIDEDNEILGGWNYLKEYWGWNDRVTQRQIGRFLKKFEGEFNKRENLMEGKKQ